MVEIYDLRTPTWTVCNTIHNSKSKRSVRTLNSGKIRTCDADEANLQKCGLLRDGTERRILQVDRPQNASSETE